MEAGEGTWRRPVGRGDASGGGAANGYVPSGAREVESGSAGEEGRQVAAGKRAGVEFEEDAAAERWGEG